MGKKLGLDCSAPPALSHPFLPWEGDCAYPGAIRLEQFVLTVELGPLRDSLIPAFSSTYGSRDAGAQRYLLWGYSEP